GCGGLGLAEEVLELAAMGGDAPADGLQQPGAAGGKQCGRGRAGGGAGWGGGGGGGGGGGTARADERGAGGEAGHQAGELVAGAVDAAPERGNAGEVA